MKKLFALLLAACLLLTMAACSRPDAQPQPSAEDSAQTTQTTEPSNEANTAVNTAAFDEFVRPETKEDGKIKIGLLHGTLTYEFTVRMVDQCKLECAYRGWEYVDGLYEQAADVRDVWKTLINEGCNAIIITQLDNVASYADLVAESRNAGIGVYSCVCGVTDGVIADSTLSSGIAAMELAYYVGQEYGFDANVAILCAVGAQVHLERGRAYEGILNGVFPDYKCLAFQDAGGIDDSIQNCYDYTQAWLQQYGDELNVVFGTNDAFAMSAAEAIKASGDTTGEKTITVGMDGGNDTWAAIRKGGPFKMSYAQPTELFMHATLELVDQIQVKGLNPGDAGCSISKVGQTQYFSGGIVTAENLPESGGSIHSAFDYYTEPENPDAWYNWCPEGYEIYTIE